MKQALACLREALAGGGVGDERQAGSLGGTAFRGGAAVCDDGGRLGESRGGRFRALLPEAEGASACVCARATSQREAGGRRRARTLRGPAVRRGVAVGDRHGRIALGASGCPLCAALPFENGEGHAGRLIPGPRTGRV